MTLLYIPETSIPTCSYIKLDATKILKKRGGFFVTTLRKPCTVKKVILAVGGFFTEENGHAILPACAPRGSFFDRVFDEPLLLNLSLQRQ